MGDFHSHKATDRYILTPLVLPHLQYPIKVKQVVALNPEGRIYDRDIHKFCKEVSTDRQVNLEQKDPGMTRLKFGSNHEDCTFPSLVGTRKNTFKGFHLKVK